MKSQSSDCSKNEVIERCYYVVFRSANYKPVKRLFKDGFSHMFLVGTTTGHWVALDPRNSTMKIELIKKKKEDTIEQLLADEECHCLEVHSKFIDKKWFSFNPFRMFTCVTLCRYMLGLKLFAITPYGVYKKLKKMEARTKYYGNIQLVKTIK